MSSPCLLRVSPSLWCYVLSEVFHCKTLMPLTCGLVKMFQILTTASTYKAQSKHPVSSQTDTPVSGTTASAGSQLASHAVGSGAAHSAASVGQTLGFQGVLCPSEVVGEGAWI